MRFSRAEAENKLNCRVRLTADIDGVAAGTLGRVRQVDEIEENSFDVIVEWEARFDGKIQHDWFSKEQYQRYLIDEPDTA